MEFCSSHASNLDAAFSSLPRNRSDDPTSNPPVAIAPSRTSSLKSISKALSSKSETTPSFETPEQQHHAAAKELSTLLLSLRKLREALLATNKETDLLFSRRVHMFCVRTALLAKHPPSYYPALRRLLEDLNPSTDPLDPAELKEFATYLILDYAARQDDLERAYELRARLRARYGDAARSLIVDSVLHALVHRDWVVFWRTRKDADGYMRSLLDWAADVMRRRALKAVGKSYLMADVGYIVDVCAGEKGEWTWEQLAERENIGWRREGDKILIKTKKPATSKQQ